MEHQPQGEDEIELQVGDTITLHKNLWNGYSRGHNHRTNKVGNYPEYKIQEKPSFVNFN
jgi:hypothetical protein